MKRERKETYRVTHRQRERERKGKRERKNKIEQDGIKRKPATEAKK